MDIELKKAFTEVQMNKLDCSKKIRILDMQIDNSKKSKQRLEITDKEVSSLDASTKVYNSIGRMFALSTVTDMSSDLKGKQHKINDLMVQYQKNKDFLLNEHKKKEDNLREFVQERREADGVLA